MRWMPALALLAPIPASAWDSEPAELLFTDRANLFDSIETVDTGPIPSGSPLAVRFFLNSLGGVESEIEGDSSVTWPDPLTHGMAGRTQGGWMALDSTLSANLVLVFDVDLGFTTYRGSVAVWNDTLRFETEQVFDGLLLADDAVNTVELVSEGESFDTVRLPLNIMTGLDVALTLDIFPRAMARLSEGRIETDASSMTDIVTVTASDATSLYPVPSDDPGLLELTSKWIGRLESSLDVVLVPAAELCVLGSCWQVIDFEYPVTVSSSDDARTFRPWDYEHPLPAMRVELTEYDFGEVELGNLRNLELPLYNDGRMDLAGTARIEGSAWIKVYPATFFAAPGGDDGLVVTFEPGVDVEETAVLILESNDPSQPHLEIPLTGAGWVEPEPEDTGDTGLVDPGPDNDAPTEHVRTCGCASGDGVARSGFSLSLGLLALAGLRRRRS